MGKGNSTVVRGAKSQTDRKSAPSIKNDQDVVLLKRVAVKDREAFEELYRNFYPQLTRFLTRLICRQEMVEELVNDTLFVVWEKAGDFQGRSKVSTWIIGIAYLKGIKALDRLKMMPEQQAAPMKEIEELEADNSQIKKLGTRDWLRSGLNQISPEQRSVVELTYFFGCSYLEIAGIMDCPVNTVKTRMFHARRRLEKLLPVLGDQIACEACESAEQSCHLPAVSRAATGREARHLAWYEAEY